MNRWRDALAWSLANFALRYIATSQYRDSVDGLIRRGLKETVSGHSQESVE